MDKGSAMNEAGQAVAMRAAVDQAIVAMQSGDIPAADALIAPFLHLDAAEIIRVQALCASRERRYHDAAALWQRCAERQPLARADQGRLGLALEQCGDIAAALSAYRVFLPAKGKNAGGVPREAALHATLGHPVLAIDVLDEAVALHLGTPIEAEMRRLRARVAADTGRLTEALADQMVADALQPDDPSALIGMIDIFLKDRDAAQVRRLLKIAASRFPEDRRFLAHEARLINQQGDDGEMRAFLGRVARLPTDAAQLRRIVLKLVNGRNHYFSDALQQQLADLTGGDEELQRLIFRRRSQESDESGALRSAQEVADAHHAYPDSPAAVVARGDLAEALINAGDVNAAESVIDALRMTVQQWPYSPPILGQIFEWQDAQHGRIAQAQASYWHRRRMMAGRDRSHELQCLKPLSGPPPSVVVFCQLRNEILMLPAFFAHYRRIGVRSFVIIDNGSTDGSREWLLDQADVELYSTSASFRRAAAGNHWFNPLIARPDYADTLCLRVDADEHLVYPHYESRPISALWDHMRAEGAEVLAGFMLDMLPRTMAALDDAQADFPEACRHFDPPAPPTPYILAPYVNHSGGPRSRLLDYRPQFLTKSSGLRGGGQVEQLHASHCTSPARVASVSMALLHYKFRPDFADRARRIAGEHQYANSAQEFACYAEWQADRAQSMLSPTSLRSEGSQSLIDAGVIRSTPQWDAHDHAPVPPPVTLHWATVPIVRDNWGDKLNPHLVELLTGRPARHADHVDRKDPTPIHSVIGSHLANANGRTIVWGTGFITTSDQVRETPRQICAVRGPISRQMLLDQGIDCPPCYGDPALLFPLFYRPAMRKRYKLGLIRHVRDQPVTAIPPLPEGVIEIDINGDLLHVVDQISACRRIASSSLHGIIAAHAYGVPALWLKLSDNVRGDGTKFRDYYASTGTWDIEPVSFGEGDSYRDLYDLCHLPAAPVDLAALLRACPFIDTARQDELIARL
jgi:tetratricopeptide (TPR) repeat protein